MTSLKRESLQRMAEGKECKNNGAMTACVRACVVGGRTGNIPSVYRYLPQISYLRDSSHSFGAQSTGTYFDRKHF